MVTRRILVLVVLILNVLSLPLVVSSPTINAITCPDGSWLPDEEAHNCPPAPADCRNSFLGLPAWYKYLEIGTDPQTGDTCSIIGPRSDNPDNPGQLDWPRVISYVAVAVVEALLRVASLVAVGYVIYGGFRYITSQGEPENAKSARQTIINALIGLVIAVAAASIISFVANRLTT